MDLKKDLKVNLQKNMMLCGCTTGDWIVFIYFIYFIMLCVPVSVRECMAYYFCIQNGICT